jgi:hypothetical protein
VRTALPLLLVLTACVDDESPYADGGNWAIDQCDRAERLLIEARADEQIGGGTRDFTLLDQYAYQVSLSHFCGHTVVLTVGDMGIEESVAVFDDLVSLYDGRSPSAPPLTVITTWYRTADDRIPGAGDLRRFAELVGTDLLERGVDPDGHIVDDQGTLLIPVLRDRPRFENAAAAAAAMWQASDAPEPLIRFRRETEVAGRWGVRQVPYFAVLHPPVTGSGVDTPTPILVALGPDLEADRIVEAAQIDPTLWVPCPDGDTDAEGC